MTPQEYDLLVAMADLEDSIEQVRDIVVKDQKRQEAKEQFALYQVGETNFFTSAARRW